MLSIPYQTSPEALCVEAYGFGQEAPQDEQVLDDESVAT